ncbi:hypothetical protein [Halolamina salifodinae]|uniref:Uncharacterized protein n=1 Tax=Halolamina salifodinae TaxID=1202767 RepID=A0A8T4GVE5_9EURY|nr:hypothetical protein [Halolamina salifodinae]MBP1986987.1 hypothetical protein [Halolamina salifodinae]
MRKDHLFLWSISLLVFPVIVYLVFGTVEHVGAYYLGSVIGGGPALVITNWILKRFDFLDYLFLVGGVSVCLVLLGVTISSVVITIIGIVFAVYPIGHTTYSMFYAGADEQTRDEEVAES